MRAEIGGALPRLRRVQPSLQTSATHSPESLDPERAHVHARQA